MSDRSSAIATHIEYEEVRRTELLRVVLIGGGSIGVLILVLFIVLGLLIPDFPAQFLVPIVVVYIAAVLLSAWLLRRGRRVLAAGIYLGATTISLFVASFWVNGSTGPLVSVIVVMPVAAALLSGREGVIQTGVGILVIYGALAVAQALGVVQPWQVSGPALQVVQYGITILVLAMVTSMMASSVGMTQNALATAQRRDQELAAARLEAEDAARAERLARERVAAAGQQLRQTVREYSAFLERVSAGDYSARLDVGEMEDAVEGPGELSALGQQLNATVEILGKTLSDMEAVQRRYVRETWADWIERGGIHRGFRYTNAAVEAADEAWLAPMTKAIRARDVSADEEQMALPVVLRDEVIGAIGVRREQAAEWTAEDLAMAQAIVSQLSQTIEGLRLLDETRRRAARDRLVGEITARVRESLDVRTVLETAANELYEQLGLEKVIIHLSARDAARHDGDGAST
jgi:GAF domain-containing protein